MLGLWLFISALSVLIICARMHDCHVLILWVCEPVILIRIIEKQNALKTWQANNKEARSIVCFAHSQCRCAITRCHMAGDIIKPEIELWLWAVSTPRTAAPYGEDASKRKKKSNKSIQNKMSKMYAECSYL